MSLALNLLVAGLVGGAILGRPAPGEAPAIRTLGLGPFALALPREARDEVRDRVEADMAEVRRKPGRDRAQPSWRCVGRAFLSDPFRPGTRRTARSDGRGRRRFALQAQGHGALLDTLESMSAAETSRCGPSA